MLSSDKTTLIFGLVDLPSSSSSLFSFQTGPSNEFGVLNLEPKDLDGGIRILCSLGLSKLADADKLRSFGDVAGIILNAVGKRR